MGAGSEVGGWTNDPGRNSLRLLPSGPDRVGERPVRRQPPTALYRLWRLSRQGGRDSRSRQPPNADEDRDQGQRRPELEIGPEADLDPRLAGALDDDEVGDRAEDREIAGERRRHGEGEPGGMRV